MPDEDVGGSPEPTPVTPEAGGAEQLPATEGSTDGPFNWESDENPYKGRYEHMRPEFDRYHNRTNELEQFFGALTDPETQAQALAALGLEMADLEEVDDEDYDEPDEADRLERIEQFLYSQQEEQQNAEIQKLENEYVTEAISEVTKAANVELTAEEKRVVEMLAKHPEMRDEDGIPDVEAAFEAWKTGAEANLGRYRESKRAPRVELGQAGTEKVNLADDDARIRATAAIIEASRQAEQ